MDIYKGGNFIDFNTGRMSPAIKTLYIYINEEKLYENFKK